MWSDQSEPPEEKEVDGGSVVKDGGGERNLSSFRTEEKEEEAFTYVGSYLHIHYFNILMY